jgi:hypothetical protein
MTEEAPTVAQTIAAADRARHAAFVLMAIYKFVDERFVARNGQSPVARIRNRDCLIRHRFPTLSTVSSLNCLRLLPLHVDRRMKS